MKNKEPVTPYAAAPKPRNHTSHVGLRVPTTYDCRDATRPQQRRDADVMSPPEHRARDPQIQTIPGIPSIRQSAVNPWPNVSETWDPPHPPQQSVPSVRTLAAQDTARAEHTMRENVTVAS